MGKIPCAKRAWLQTLVVLAVVSSPTLVRGQGASDGVVPPPEPGSGATIPENSPTYIPKDDALAHKRKADEAADSETKLKEYEAALALEPRFAPWWGNFGDFLGELGRWPEAESAFKRAVELDPAEPEYRAGLALAALRQGRRDEAIQHGKAAQAIARAQHNELHGTHPVYAELNLPKNPEPSVPTITAPPARRAATQQKSYRGLEFSVVGVKKLKEHEGSTAAPGNDLVIVSTVIDRGDFKSDFRGDECKLERATLVDDAREAYRSTEQQRRVTAQLRAEDGRPVGDREVSYDWTFQVPEGKRLKTFKFEFDDERIETGGADPDENVTDLAFDLE
jgi:tetratricopeptide (TPR) repeat protein